MGWIIILFDRHTEFLMCIFHEKCINSLQTYLGVSCIDGTTELHYHRLHGYLWSDDLQQSSLNPAAAIQHHHHCDAQLTSGSCWKNLQHRPEFQAQHTICTSSDNCHNHNIQKNFTEILLYTRWHSVSAHLRQLKVIQDWIHTSWCECLLDHSQTVADSSVISSSLMKTGQWLYQKW